MSEAKSVNSKTDFQSSAVLKRVGSILENEQIFDSIPVDSLEYLGSLIKMNTCTVRRNLRSILESQLLAIHSKFVDEYETKVVEHLEAKIVHIDALQDMTTESIDKLSISYDRLSNVVTRCTRSHQMETALESELEVMNRFRAMFVIDQEIATRVNETRLGPDVLVIYDEIETKRRNCKRLIELNPNANLAVDSLNKSFPLLDILFEKISNSITRNLIESRADLKKALDCLSERPHYLSRCISAIARERSSRLNEAFVRVLVHGDNEEEGLESHAFDSPRFLSDMLHWFFEQLVVENDQLVLTTEVSNYLDQVLSGAEEMISDRVDTMLKSTFGVVELFKLGSIVGFYQAKIDQLPLIVATHTWIATLFKTVWSKFCSEWQKQIEEAKLLPHEVSTSSLGPWAFLNETVFLVNSLFEVAANEGPDSAVLRSLRSVLNIDDLVSVVRDVAKSLDEAAQSCVFLVNCFLALQQPFQNFPDESEKLQGLIDEEMETLVRITCDSILQKVGLLDKWQLVHEGAKEKVLPLALSASFKGFYTALFTQGIWTVGHVECLQKSELRTRARLLIGTKLATVYEDLYSAFPDIGSHSPDQIRILLDL